MAVEPFPTREDLMVFVRDVARFESAPSHPVTRPDVLKLARAAEDSMEAAGVQAVTAERPQHMDALDKANAVYSQMAHLRKELKRLPRPDALALLADMLCAPDDCLDSALGALRVGKALSAVRGVGGPRAERMLADALGSFRPDASRRVRDMTVRQRRCLAGVLRVRAGVEDREAA